MNGDAGQLDVVRQLHFDPGCCIAIDAAARDSDMIGEGVIGITATLDGDAGGAIVARDIAFQQECAGAGDDVEAVAIVGIGQVVAEHAVDLEIGDEPVQAVVVGYRILDQQPHGALVRIEAIAAEIAGFDPAYGYIFDCQGAAGCRPGKEGVDLLGVVLSVAVERKVQHGDVADLKACRGPHEAVDLLGDVVLYLQDG